jgi:uncharacterized protein (DUF952 family)
MAAPSPLPQYLYKIYAVNPQTVEGISDLDRASGFIHSSTSRQVPITADRFFSGATTLWLQKIPLVQIKDILKWESNDEDVFPHLYHEDLEKAIPTNLDVLVWKRNEGQNWGSVTGELLGLEY